MNDNRLVKVVVGLVLGTLFLIVMGTPVFPIAVAQG